MVLTDGAYVVCGPANNGIWQVCGASKCPVTSSEVYKALDSPPYTTLWDCAEFNALPRGADVVPYVDKAYYTCPNGIWRYDNGTKRAVTSMDLYARLGSPSTVTRSNCDLLMTKPRGDDMWAPTEGVFYSTPSGIYKCENKTYRPVTSSLVYVALGSPPFVTLNDSQTADLLSIPRGADMYPMQDGVYYTCPGNGTVYKYTNGVKAFITDGALPDGYPTPRTVDCSLLTDCTANYGCDRMHVCTAGKCVPGCVADDFSKFCPTGMKCVDRVRCENECAINTDCSDGKSCTFGRCVSPATGPGVQPPGNQPSGDKPNTGSDAGAGDNITSIFIGAGVVAVVLIVLVAAFASAKSEKTPPTPQK